MTENCESCAFGVGEWMHNHRRITYHRHAPTSIKVQTGIMNGEAIYGPRTFWPEVAATDFCGDWELTDAKS